VATFSAVLQADTLDTANLLFAGEAFTPTSQAGFNLITGEITGIDAGLEGASMEDLGSGLWRCQIQMIPTSTASGSAQIRFDGIKEIGESFFATAGDSEDLPFASSYIPTQATPVTRAADLLALDVASTGTPPAGEDFTQAITTKAPVAVGVSQDAWTGTVRFSANNSSSNATVGLVVSTQTGVLAPSTESTRAMLTYTTVGTSFYINYGAQVSTASVATNSATTGTSPGGGSNQTLYGHVKDYVLYNQVIPPANDYKGGGGSPA
jgi:hypothetical protein